MKSILTSWIAVLVLNIPAAIGATSAQTFILPPDGENIIGSLQFVTARYEDTLIDIARRHNLGFDEIQQANPTVDAWLPGEGTVVLLPTQFILPEAAHEGIVLNIAEMRLYYYPKAKAGEPRKVITYPVSVGRGDWKTPKGLARIIQKQQNPTWTPPESVRKEHAAEGDILPRVVPPGPDNPLGAFAMRLNLPGYLIHGTNKPNGIGMRVTHGCVRLQPDDIKDLYSMVEVGTQVEIVDQPYKTTWKNGVLYFEAHPPSKSDVYEGANEPVNLTEVVRELIAATKDHPNYPLDWDKAQNMAKQRLGIPLPVMGQANQPQITGVDEVSPFAVRP